MKNSLLALSLFFSFLASAQITKIEHFFLSSPDAEKLQIMFRDKFKLPEIWKYQTWGDFSSGGVSLGNVAFEFVNYKGIDTTKFGGIAFEPKQDLETFIPFLDKAGIAHDTIADNTRINADGKRVGWATLGLFGLLPTEANIFICDYKERDRVAANRKKGSDSLQLIKGGPLGIIALKELVIHTNDFITHNQKFQLLPGVMLEDNNLFVFSSGPSIRLVESSSPSFEKMVLKVNSLKSAKDFLSLQNLLGSITTNSVFISEKSIGGLKVELVE